MKKYLCLFMSLVLMIFLVGCRPISHSAGASGRVVYDYHDISFEAELTQEEVSAVLEILNGKVPQSALAGTPSCGFNQNIAIIIDGTRYALACDKCGVLQNCGTMQYIHITDEERVILEEIFTSRGGKFPCI